MGLGLTVAVNAYRTTTPNVSCEEKVAGNYLYRTFHTPVGDVSEKLRINLPKGTGGQWKVEKMIKGLEDYEVAKSIVEDTVYEPDYGDFSRVEQELGGDGVFFAWGDYTPLMKIIVGLMGFERFAVELYRHRDELEELIEAIDGKEEEMYRIVADSPAEIIKVGDNIDGALIDPKLFETYCLPYYQKYSKILHAKGKIVMSHMDGRLRCLKDLIGETELDMIEAFTPPPNGDLPVPEARAAWGEKLAIWINVPEAIFYYEPAQMKKYILDLLRDTASEGGFLLGITEDPPTSRFEVGLEIITATIQKYGKISRSSL